MRTLYCKEKIVHENHWKRETFCQRITAKEWKLLLLNNDDRITFEGRVRQLVVRKMGFGVVEMFKKPLTKE